MKNLLAKIRSLFTNKHEEQLTELRHSVLALSKKVKELEAESEIEYRLLAREIEYDDLADEVSHCSLADYIDMTDLAKELDIDVSDIASELDITAGQVAAAIEDAVTERVGQAIISALADTFKANLAA